MQDPEKPVIMSITGFSFPIKEINYIEVYNHTLLYHTAGGSFSSTDGKSMRRLADDLKDDGFALCNQCYLVNLHRVEALDRDSITMKSGERLKISRNRYKEFKHLLISYWGE